MVVGTFGPQPLSPASWPPGDQEEPRWPTQDGESEPKQPHQGGVHRRGAGDPVPQRCQRIHPRRGGGRHDPPVRAPRARAASRRHDVRGAGGAGAHRPGRCAQHVRGPPNLVLSGINRGADVGRAILHSGTVGAALAGGSMAPVAEGLGAVSLDVGIGARSQYCWDSPLEHVAELIPRLVEQPAGHGVQPRHCPASEPVARSCGRARSRPSASCRPRRWAPAMTRDSRSPIPLRIRPRAQISHCLSRGFATVTSIQPVSEAATAGSSPPPAR